MAKFETKFEVGQEIYIIHGGNIKNYPITSIKIEQFMNGRYGLTTCLVYGVGGGSYKEEQIFATKEEAVVKWLESQNVDMLIIKGAIK